MADHSSHENHPDLVSQSGGAIVSPKPIIDPPRRKKHTGQSSGEDQSTRAGEGRAIQKSKPNAATPAPDNDTGQCDIETQCRTAGEGRAIVRSATKGHAPAPENSAGHRSPEIHTRCASGADRTMVEPLSNARTSDPQKSPKGAHGAGGEAKPNIEPPHAKYREPHATA